ncbi:hypothetical protein M427DRAFT_35254 [Gonapodya prolifera JEL478]|uniref:Uncharacterized protein n=1 Tax=Gonapodya prolifera (strain JEL478) TaxID=1344416 RepID=A0A139A546_GONPJ|nr:hypothetical protein M427DRAFT_35254 [Gonapodya prolifera JEL478]|eukprot:KXS11942.1 hypothetical protein M427DRAFT_35254 [Gonapodya prolifera JEL478]
MDVATFELKQMDDCLSTWLEHLPQLVKRVFADGALVIGQGDFAGWLLVDVDTPPQPGLLHPLGCLWLLDVLGAFISLHAPSAPCAVLMDGIPDGFGGDDFGTEYDGAWLIDPMGGQTGRKEAVWYCPLAGLQSGGRPEEVETAHRLALLCVTALGQIAETIPSVRTVAKIAEQYLFARTGFFRPSWRCFSRDYLSNLVNLADISGSLETGR